ncbi:ParB/RepB/Spo0J family partition protein [Patescibacteria group bacterium]|nr:MAG: ParB/RepB/Spo0J family partition protein [Patescibacteria group bacterium]
MVTSRGLGRGLGALIPKKFSAGLGTLKTASNAVKAPEKNAAPPVVLPAAGAPLLLPIERVLPNPKQPREHFSHRELEELIQSIKTHGIIQPLLVTEKPDGTYELIAGERRLRAARLAGLTSVPAIIRGAEEREKLELALIENLQRQDLNPLEEARAYRRLLDEYGLNQEEVAARVGKSRPQIANTLRLLELPAEIQDAVKAGTIPVSAARTLLSFESKDEQLRWWQKLTAEKMTVREVEEAARRVGVPRRVSIPDANIEADEAALRSALGTKVAVKKHGEAGKIEVTFFSEEEYRALVKKLTGEGGG